jgi:glyoxylase-like metal-dependent hydrolase (beta-lactamase superfamily II)
MLLLLAAIPALAGSERTVTRIADGIYVIQHKDSPAIAGNTTVIVGDRAVFVVDSGYLPSQAREDIAQIRTWSKPPVAFLLNTHWHNDHNVGNFEYASAFPAVTIIAHKETKRQMDSFAPGSLKRQKATLDRINDYLASGKLPDGTPLTANDRKELQADLPGLRQEVEDLKDFRYQPPTLTFENGFDIDLGGREVQIKFLGRGNTGGDAVVFLPKEKIAITGDLVAAPTPNTLDGYPEEWIATLRALQNLQPAIIVPGHGAVMHDQAYIENFIALLQSAIDQVRARLHELGPALFRSLDEVQSSVDLKSFRKKFVGDDQFEGERFDEEVKSLVKIVFLQESLR